MLLRWDDTDRMNTQKREHFSIERPVFKRAHLKFLLESKAPFMFRKCQRTVNKPPIYEENAMENPEL